MYNSVEKCYIKYTNKLWSPNIFAKNIYCALFPSNYTDAMKVCHYITKATTKMNLKRIDDYKNHKNRCLFFFNFVKF